MDKTGFRSFLAAKGTPEKDIDSFVNIVVCFEDHLSRTSGESSNERIEAVNIEAFSDELIKSGENTWDNYLALARYAQFRQDHVAFKSIVELIDGCEVMHNLYNKVGISLGEDMRGSIFEGVDLPPMGTPNTKKPPITQTVMGRLESQTDPQTCRALLIDCLRDLPDEDYFQERKKYLACDSLDDYLEQRETDFLAELETIKEDGGLFYTQPVTDEVIEFMRDNPEISNVVRRGNTLYKTKIPYQTDEYLKETDEDLKRYHYCHCPWVRESLKDGDAHISSTFCNCSAGYVKKPWEVIFGQPLQVELLESILDGNPRCRFAIQLPEGV